MLQCHTRPFLYNVSVGRARKNGIGFVEWFLVLFWGYFPWYFNSSFRCDLFFRGFWCKFTTFNIMQETEQCIPCLSFAVFFSLNIHIVYTPFFLLLKVRIIGLLRSDRCSWIKAPLSCKIGNNRWSRCEESFCADTGDFCLKCTLEIKMCTKLVSPHDFLLSQCRHQLRR